MNFKSPAWSRLPRAFLRRDGSGGLGPGLAGVVAAHLSRLAVAAHHGVPGV